MSSFQETCPGENPVLYEGPVKFTKFYACGMKTKKNWTNRYLVLNPFFLKFYKDQKSYLASRVVEPCGSGLNSKSHADMFLPLNKNTVRHCTPMDTRRYKTSLVLTEKHLNSFNQYMIQDKTEEGIERWLHEIEKFTAEKVLALQ